MNHEATIAWKVRIRAPLAARVELMLLDPVRLKAKYRSRKDLIEYLLERWLQEQTENA